MNTLISDIRKRNIGFTALILIGVIAVIGMLKSPIITQTQNYHNFSDINTFLAIPNFWNVVSNIPFLVVGCLGLIRLSKLRKTHLQYIIFFLGIFLIAVGSSYYHLFPNNATLVWDRLPMSIAFMAMLSIVISEFIHEKGGRILLIPLLIIGIFSVLYWMIYNDLRPYVLVQFYPVLAIPIILLSHKSKFNMVFGYWAMFVCYALAKGFEFFDTEIHNTFKILSGHSLKHLITSIGIAILLYTYMKRNKQPKQLASI